MIFGTPVDITLSELALETFFPVDDLTASGCGAWRLISNSSLLASNCAYLWGSAKRGGRHEHPKTASDRHRFRRGVPVVLHRQAPDRERAGAAPDVPVEIHWRPFFSNSWVPREGISRDEYLTANSAQSKPTKGSPGASVAAAQ